MQRGPFQDQRRTASSDLLSLQPVSENPGHFAAYTSAAKEQIEWQSQETLCWFDSSEKARRGFCGKCGASLFYELKGGAGLSITAGSIENPTGLHAAGHIYFENHSDYYEVLDQLPKFRENSSEDFPD